MDIAILSLARNRGEWKGSGGSKDLNAQQHGTLSFALNVYSVPVSSRLKLLLIFQL